MCEPPLEFDWPKPGQNDCWDPGGPLSCDSACDISPGNDHRRMIQAANQFALMRRSQWYPSCSLNVSGFRIVDCIGAGTSSSARRVSAVGPNGSGDEMSTAGDVIRMDLDSHANMPVLGKGAYVLADLDKACEVAPYHPGYDPIRIPMVDAAVKYESPFDGREYILVVRGALHVPSMDYHLIPPFMLREAGLQVRETPKIQLSNPTEEDHAIVFKETGLRIPLSLHGTFSYFPTTTPTYDDLVGEPEVYLLTPPTWNPHSVAYALNESALVDWEGNVPEQSARPKKILVEQLPDDDVMASALVVSSQEAAAVDFLLEDRGDPGWRHANLCDQLHSRAQDGDFMMCVGAVDVPTVVSDDDADGEMDLDEEEEQCDLMGYLMEQEDISEDDPVFNASGTFAKAPTGVSPAHLSKVWRISQEDAVRTLKVTSQREVRPRDPTLSRNYGTNDRMLRYRRIDEHFFMDTFFATKKGGRSTRGNTCCQLFATDKGFLFVVPMQRRGQVLEAMKMFAKEIGAPSAFVADMSKEQMSKDVKLLCNEIGSTLRALEEGTPWSNKAELYIGLLKEAVRKDLKESDSPMKLWDYCVERRARIHNLTAKSNLKLSGTNPLTATLGEEGDISSLCQYGWYEWCYFREQTAAFPNNKEVLGRVLGPARGAGNEMCQWVLKANGRVVPRRSVRSLQTAEIHSPTELKKRELFDKLIAKKLGTSIVFPDEKPSKDKTPEELDEEADQQERMVNQVPDAEDIVDSTGRVIDQQPAYDKLINAEIQMQLGNQVATGPPHRWPRPSQASAYYTAVQGVRPRG